MESQSLVTNVLAKTGLLPKEDLWQRRNKLFAQVNDLKGEVCQRVTDRYVDFVPSVDTMGELRERVKTVDRDIEELKKTLKVETGSKLKNLTEMKDMMEEAHATVVILTLLNQVHNDFGTFKMHLRNKEYIEAAAVLRNVECSSQTLADSPFCEHQIVVALHTESVNPKTKLYEELDQMWYKCILFSKTKEDRSLTVVTRPQLINMLEAMHTMDVLRWKLQVFASQFKEIILDPVIRESASKVTVEKSEKELKMSVVHQGSETREVTDARPPTELYSDLREIFESLHGLFSRCQFEDLGETVSLMKMLGALLWRDISDNLIDHCLAPSIPSSADDLENYKSTITATQQFEEALKTLDFIGDETPLLEYAENVNIHFATKKCQDILVQARDLMKEDLFTAVKVGQKKDESRKISEFFPVCKISKSTLDLVQLGESTLQEATSNGCSGRIIQFGVCVCVAETYPDLIGGQVIQKAAQLFLTVRNSFGMYVDVVPTYHKRSLEDLPQVTALFHNNCMYLVHKLKTMGHRYRHTLPSPLRDGIITFVDLVPTFTRMASEVFLAQMRHQRDQLKESLALARGFLDVSSDDVFPEAERSIKQVLHQLTRLHSVWSDVLPTSTFIKAMSTLIGAVLQDIVEKVIALEDISAEDARQLHELLNRIKDKMPSLLKSKYSKDTVVPALHIKEWARYSELLFILEASMKDIVERWADGKGPLAEVFDHLQIKSLMRALFQNNERRADALGRIRNL